jgi:hypothetical protein
MADERAVFPTVEANPEPCESSERIRSLDHETAG